MTRIFTDVKQEENELLQKAADMDMRSKSRFVAKAALDKAREVVANESD